MTSNKTLQTRNMILIALFAALIAVGAFIRIPIPGVPFTLQFFFTNLAGLILGKRCGALASGVYIATGLLGLPVFTGGGGIGYILQPTFGYLLGFVAGAWLAGFLLEKSGSGSFRAMLSAGLANLAVVYLLGMVYYYWIANYYAHTPIGVAAVIVYCCLLTLPGDLVLCVLAAVIGRRIYPLLQKKGRL